MGLRGELLFSVFGVFGSVLLIEAFENFSGYREPRVSVQRSYA